MSELERHPLLDRVFAPLVGRCPWEIGVSYADWLGLSFGEPTLVRRPSKHLDGRVSREFSYETLQGEWQLLTQDCRWKLLARAAGLPNLAHDDASESLELRLRRVGTLGALEEVFAARGSVNFQVRFRFERYVLQTTSWPADEWRRQAESCRRVLHEEALAEGDPDQAQEYLEAPYSPHEEELWYLSTPDGHFGVYQDATCDDPDDLESESVRIALWKGFTPMDGVHSP